MILSYHHFSECQWKENIRKLDCKFANLTKIGGLEKVAEKKVRILDLSHCKIKNAQILLKVRISLFSLISQLFCYIKDNI